MVGVHPPDQSKDHNFLREDQTNGGKRGEKPNQKTLQSPRGCMGSPCPHQSGMNRKRVPSLNPRGCMGLLCPLQIGTDRRKVRRRRRMHLYQVPSPSHRGSMVLPYPHQWEHSLKNKVSNVCKTRSGVCFTNTVEPPYNEVLGTMKITLLYQVSRYIRVKKQRNIKSWDQQNDLVIRGFCYIRPLYNKVPLYND